VKIPSSVRKIYSKAFSGCGSIESVYCQAIEPPSCNSGVFDTNIYGIATLYVPEESLSAYKTVDPWRNFIRIEEIDFAGVGTVDSGDGVTVTVDGGAIRLSGEACPVEVYSIGGQCVFHGTTDRIEGLAKGIYIVKTGTSTVKVAI